MPDLMLPGDTGLLLLPKIEMGSGAKSSPSTTVAGLASDYTWSMIIVTMACAVMVVVSAMKGVRRFSFALTYTNLWCIFGKKGRLKLRVHSFTSTNGSNCFVTTSGEFSAELVKEEEELEKQSDSSFLHRTRKANDDPAAGRAGCIVGTEMVFIVNDRTSIFTAGRLARFDGSSSSRKKSYREALCTPATAAQGSSSSSRNNLKHGERLLSRSARALKAAGELPEWQIGTFRSGMESSSSSSRRKSLVPDWAWELLVDIDLSGPFPAVLQQKKRRSFGSSLERRRSYDSSWDSVLRLRLAGAEEGRLMRPGRVLSYGTERIVYPSAAVAGPIHTATLRNNVVKLWDNSSRRSVATLRPPFVSSNIFVSSFDVDWDKDAVAFGNSIGELSLWDLETVKCVASLRAHEGSLTSLHFNRMEQLEQDAWFLTAGRSSAAEEESGSCISIWDSRALTKKAAASRSGGPVRFSSIDGLKAKDYEFLVATDDKSRISMYDIRILRPSPVFAISAEDELRSVGCKDGSQVAVMQLRSDQQEEEENWWDAGGAMEESSDGDVDFEEDFWGTVDEEIVKSPSVLSRCFTAISSAISR